MICPKHDVVYQEGKTCWCCDQAKAKEKVAKPAANTEGERKFTPSARA